MISDPDIRRAYSDDQRRPYYSVQAGRSHAPAKRGRTAVALCKPARAYRSDPVWTWGHFQAALKRALKAA